ncbi:MAG: PDZ domain-containing protein [Planctomycetes bacterium]|nr:PDZ domain-containing protein [Planctomycetota bacterium]
MKRLVLALAAIATGGLLWALEDEADLAKWVRDLASEDQDVREAAVEKLAGAGEQARPMLEAAAESKDPEVAFQAKRLLRRLERAGEAPAPEEQEKPAPGPRAGRRGGSMRLVVSMNGEQAQITEGADGKVHVKVTSKDGEVTEYDGDGREDFAKKHPEVAKKYGLDKDGFSFGWKVAPGRPGGAPLPGEADEMLKELEKMQEEMLKKLQQPGGFEEFQKELEKALGEHREPRSVRPANRLGIAVGPVGEALRYQLDLPEGGVLVNDVPDGSHGAKLGLQKYDILLSVNGRKISDAADIREALGEEGKVTAEVIREGERTALKEE